VYNFPQEGENDEYPVADNEPPGFHGASWLPNSYTPCMVNAKKRKFSWDRGLLKNRYKI
jgi:hypothetical protein